MPRCPAEFQRLSFIVIKSVFLPHFPPVAAHLDIGAAFPESHSFFLIRGFKKQAAAGTGG